MINPSLRIFVAGHRGMVGSAIVRRLKQIGISEEQILTRSRSELDLTHQQAVHEFLRREKPDEIYLAAAKVGGIHANHAYPAEFIYDNLVIQTNVIQGAFAAGVKKLLFLGSSCIYPRLAEQPIREEALLTGPLEATNEPYAVAKIAGIKMCESFNRQYHDSHGIDYRSVMPTNLYGPGDNYHPDNSHVIPGLIRRFHEAKVQGAAEVSIWGTGEPLREFLHVNDMAAASVHVMGLDRATYLSSTGAGVSHLNVGSGSDMTILDLARLIAQVVGFTGVITTDPSKPDGTPRKLMDSSRLRSTGWGPSVPMEEGLQSAYADFLRSAQQSTRF